MERADMIAILSACYARGEISQIAVDAVMNAFDSTEGSFPSDYHAEIDYGDREDAEAIDGMRFDDMNYLRYRER